MDFIKSSFQANEPSTAPNNIPALSLYEISDLELALVGGGIGDVVPA